MHKSILVLEESSIVHELFDSAFQQDYPNWDISHESQPDKYVVKAKKTQPDIILLSNRDQKNDYAIVKDIQSHSLLIDVPILLLIYAKDKLDEKILQTLGIKGFVRKPFESSTIKNQIETVFRNQELKRKEQPNPDLDLLDIVDDELLGLISGKVPSPITIDNLEEELDPTLQLHPIEAESMLEDEFENTDEYEETDFIEIESDNGMESSEIDDFDDAEILDMDASGELENEDFEETGDADDDIEILEIYNGEGIYDEPNELIETELLDMDSDDEFDTESIEFIDTDRFATPYEPDFEELDQGKTEAIEIELEEISLDFDDSDSKLASIMEPEQTQYQTLELVQSSTPIKSSYLRNTSDDGDFGTMEIEVIQVEDLEIDDFEKSSEEMSFIEDDSANISSDEGYYTTLKVVYEDSDDTIEIEHEKIEEVIEDDIEDDFDENSFQEISVEGFGDDIDPEEAGDNSYVENIDSDSEIDEEEEDLDISIETLTEDEEPEEFDESSIIEKEGGTSILEVHFDDNDAQDQDTLEPAEMVIPQDDEAQEDILNFDLDDIDSNGSQLSIQEMINFRQVMKAKYEISDKENSEETSDLDEYDDMDLKSDLEYQEETDSVEDIDEEDLFTEEAEEEDEILNDDLPEQDLDDEPEVEMDMMQDELLDDDIQEEQEELLEDAAGEEDLFTEEAEEEDEILNNDLPEQDLDDEPEVEMDMMQDELLDDDIQEEQEELLEDDAGEEELFTGEAEEEDEILNDDLPEQDLDDEPEVEMDMMQDELLDDDIQEEQEELLEDPVELFEDQVELTEEPVDEMELMPDELLDDSIQEDEEELLEDPIESVEQAELADDEQKIDLLSDDLEDIPNDFSLMDDDDSTTDSTEFAVDELEEEAIVSDELITEPEENEVPADLFDDTINDDFENLDTTDEVTIEVPSDVFEMGDFKMERISENLDEDSENLDEDSENLDEDSEIFDEDFEDTTEALVNEDTDEKIEDDIFSDDIKLPSMDDDLPELPPISKTEVEEALAEDLVLPDESDDIETTGPFDNKIKVLQNGGDFESFPDETSIIGDPENVTNPDISSPQTKVESEKTGQILSADFKNKLSSLIEEIVSETVHNTLNNKLPELVNKIVQDEFGE